MDMICQSINTKKIEYVPVEYPPTEENSLLKLKSLKRGKFTKENGRNLRAIALEIK